MLYRLIEEGQPLQFEGPGDTKTVNTFSELEQALAEDWLISPLHSAHKEQLEACKAEIQASKKVVAPAPKAKKSFFADLSRKVSEAADREDDKAEEEADERAAVRAASKKRR